MIKSGVTLDFLRGILFAFVASRCYMFGNALWVGFYPRIQPYQASVSALILAVYIILFLGLLFRPVTSAKAVFVFLTLLLLPRIASAIYWLRYPVGSLPRNPFTLHFFASLFAAVAAAIIAYVHYRARQQPQRA